MKTKKDISYLHSGDLRKLSECLSKMTGKRFAQIYQKVMDVRRGRCKDRIIQHSIALLNEKRKQELYKVSEEVVNKVLTEK